MAPAQRVALARLLEQLARVTAQCRGQLKAPAARPAHERQIDELGERLEHIIDPLVANPLDPFEGRLAREVAHAAKQACRLRVEEAVGPLHRRPQTTLALGQAASARP